MVFVLWFLNVLGLIIELLLGGINGYFYVLKVLVFWLLNLFYGIVGLCVKIGKDLVDLKKLLLIILVDFFINESNVFVDYIIFDLLMYESWGWVVVWNGVLIKVMGVCWLVIELKVEKMLEGWVIGMEIFFIVLVKVMKLLGFGEGVISDVEGNIFVLNMLEDWYLCGGVNIVWLGKELVVDVMVEDIILLGVECLCLLLEKILKLEEVVKVVFLFSCGGCY